MRQRHSAGVGFACLLERDEERAGTLAALDRAVVGDGAAIGYEATAGLGKTSLLQAAVAEAEARGVRVLSARGVELDHALAFGVVGQLFSPAVRDAGGEQRARLLDGAAGLAAPVLGLAGAMPAGDPVSASLHGLYWLCVNLAETGPLMLAVDDVHWVDEPSLRFLAHLLRRLEGLSLLIVATARPAEPGASALADRLLEDETMLVYRLRALSSAATGSIVRARLTAGASDELCVACHEATGGNPFLLRELLEALRAEGVDAASASPAAVEGVAPSSIARSVLVRLARLSEDAVAIARAVAIFPAGAEFRHVASLTELDHRAAAAAIDELIAAAILAPGRPLTFLHPVLRGAVYRDLSRGMRGLLHLSAARVLRSEGAAAPAIATHLLATEPGIDGDAFGELLAAAGAALASGAPEAAIRYLNRATQEPVPAPAAASALHLRGLARMLGGDRAAVDDLRAAAAGAAPDARPAILRDLARVLAFGGLAPEAVAALDEAIASRTAGDPDLVARCIIDRTWIVWSHDDVADRFVEEMQRLQAPEHPRGLLESATAANKAGWEAWHCQDARRAIALAHAGLDNGLLAREGFDGLPPLVFGAMGLTLADRPGDALDVLGQALDAQRRTGAAMGLPYGHMITGMIRIYAGDLTEAESDLHLALQLVRGQLAGEHALAGITPLLAAVALERSGPAAAEELLADLSAPPTWARLHLLAARGRLHLAAGRPHEAVHDLQAALQCARKRGILNPIYPFPWRGDLALATMALGEPALALAYAEEDLLLARRFGAAGVVGDALRVAGLIKHGDEGLKLLRDAVDVLRASSARWLHARALADLGSALRRANQRAAAREPLLAAIDLAERCGAQRLARHATDEHLATGGRRRRTSLSGPESLTPSERRVARMAATGMTNREIAQQLYLTIKTVEMHISNTLAKLAIGSRRELPEALGDEPRPTTHWPPS